MDAIFRSETYLKFYQTEPWDMQVDNTDQDKLV
jgi:hypothetical protein